MLGPVEADLWGSWGSSTEGGRGHSSGHLTVMKAKRRHPERYQNGASFRPLPQSRRWGGETSLGAAQREVNPALNMDSDVAMGKSLFPLWIS